MRNSTVDALNAAAEALKAAATSLSTEAATLTLPALSPGDRLTEAHLEALPVDTHIEDRDRDTWVKTARGWRLGGRSYSLTQPGDYEPLTLLSVPEDPASAPAPAPVPESATFTATLPDVELAEGTFQTFRKTYSSVGATTPRQSFLIQKSVNTLEGAAVFLNAYRSGSSGDAIHLHLTKDDALELAAALVKVAQSTRPAF